MSSLKLFNFSKNFPIAATLYDFLFFSTLRITVKVTIECFGWLKKVHVNPFWNILIIDFSDPIELLETNMSPFVRRKREERANQISIATEKEIERLRIEEPFNKIPAKEGFQNFWSYFGYFSTNTLWPISRSSRFISIVLEFSTAVENSCKIWPNIINLEITWHYAYNLDHFRTDNIWPLCHSIFLKNHDTFVRNFSFQSVLLSVSHLDFFWLNALFCTVKGEWTIIQCTRKITENLQISIWTTRRIMYFLTFWAFGHPFVIQIGREV